MSTNIVYNGVTYTIPATDDVAWGDAVSNFLIAIPSGMLTKVGGAWALTGSDLDLGAAFGISSIYFKTKTATPALAGVLRLAFADAVAWRSTGNDKDLILKPDASNFLTWDNIRLVDISTTQILTNKVIDATLNTIMAIKDVNIAPDAAILYSKLLINSNEIDWSKINFTGFVYTTNTLKLGTTKFVTLEADPSSDYTLTFPATDGTASQALVRSTGTDLAWVTIPGLALTNDNIMIGGATNLPVEVDTSAVGDILADDATGLTIKALAITNAMISASAAIAFSKLEALPLPLSGGTLTGLLTLDNLGVVLDVAGTTPAAPVTGQMYWDKVNQTAALKLANTDVTLQIGQEMHIYCKNNTAAIIPNGSIVYVSGATTGLPDISLAKADLIATSDGVIGIVTETIGIGALGYVTTSGKINDVKTDVDCDGAALTIGDILYLSTSVAGGYTKTVSLTPAHQVKIGSVLKVGATDGIIMCRIEIGQHMAELHDVLLANLADRDILEYDSAAAVWKNYVNPSIVTKEPTGFSTFSNMVLTWNEGASRDLTITNPLGTYSYLIAGVSYVVAQSSTKTKQITDTEGVWYFYFDTTKTLQAIQGFTTTLLNTHALCFAAYWDSTNKKWIMRGEERHGITMDWATHAYLHKSRGAVYYTGGALTTSANVAATVLATTPTPASKALIDTQMGFDTLTMFDEDIELVLSPLTRITSPIRKLYRLGANGDWRVHAPGGLTVEPTIAAFGNVDTGATGLCYINTNPGAGWQLTAVSNNDYFNTYVFGTNDMTAANQFVLIPGQGVSSTLAGAQALSVSNLALGSLPSPEMIAVYKFTWQYKDGSRGSGPASNPVGVILHRVEDLRLAKVTGSSTTAAGVHNSLSGRSTDTAHPASAITNTPNGNLAATDLQSAVDELQSDIDTRVTLTGAEVITNKDIDGGVASDASRIQLPTATNATALNSLTDAEGSIAFTSTEKKLYVNDGTDWKVVGGGLIPTNITVSGTTPSITTLESGKHYIYNGAGASGDVTINMPAVAAESNIRVTVYNIPTTRKLSLARAGSDNFRKDDTLYTTVDFVVVEVEQSSEFVAATAANEWLVNDGSNALGTTWGGALTVTGLLTAEGGVKQSYGCRVYLASANNQTLTAGAAAATIAFASERWDPNNNHANGVYTAPKTGLYFVSYGLQVVNGATAATYIQSYVSSSGGGGAMLLSYNEVMANSKTYYVSASGLVALTAADTMSVVAACLGQNVTITGSGGANDACYFHVIYLGPIV